MESRLAIAAPNPGCQLALGVFEQPLSAVGNRPANCPPFPDNYATDPLHEAEPA